MTRKLTTEEFVAKSNKIHNNFYDYSKVEYEHSQKKICIIDPEYGEFWQIPANHLRGIGCLGRIGVRNTKQFIKKANKIHNNLYDYSKIQYKNAFIKVCIIDPEYGEFWQKPNNHLSGQGNPIRGNIERTLIQKDHIIPLSILDAYKERDKKRPLYEFLNSEINIQKISCDDNMRKSDWIDINGEIMRARDYRNDYKIIAHLSEELLHINIDEIIEQDKLYTTKRL